MKKILLSLTAILVLIAGKSQVTLNEVYTDPGNGNSELLELYNINTSQTPENLDNYTIVDYGEDDMFLCKLPHLLFQKWNFGECDDMREFSNFYTFLYQVNAKPTC